MKKLLIILSLSISINIYSQLKVDTIIKERSYTSYFSYSTHTPLFVVYKLYHVGGGIYSRKGMQFKTGGLKNSATLNDYAHQGYDIGHMLDAESETFDKNLLERTFRFYNALPQKPKLNRGIWKEFELKIRNQSQNDSLLIICGGFKFDSLMSNRIGIPRYCFKIVRNLSNNKVNCYIFPNDNSDSYKETVLDSLYNKLDFDKSLIKIIK